MEEKQLFGALTVYRERGRYLRQLEQFEKGITAYDEAYRSVSDGSDVRTLTGRSQLCIEAMKPSQAFDDADLALKLQPKNMCARNMQARAMYIMSDFERSVVMNYRGFRMRRKPSYFREGINQGIETIEDCIGRNAGSVMLNFLPLIKQSEVTRLNTDEPFPSLHVSRIPKPELKKRLTQMEARKQMTLARVMAMKYLGPMASDKFFLQHLVEDPCLDSANSAGSKELKQIVKQTLIELSGRQDMLQSIRPYYTIKYAEKAESKFQNKFKAAVLAKERKSGVRTAERLSKEMEKCLLLNRIKDVIALAERLQKFLDTKTPRTLPEKECYTDRLYRNVGEAYLSQHRLSYTLSERGNRRRIAFLMGLPVGRPKSFDSVIANYPYKFIDMKQVTEQTLATLQMCENSLMRCWLMYELARLLCKQKNYALGKFYAKRCQKEAQRVESVTWWLNGCFVLISGDMQQANVNEVRAQVDEAYEWAKTRPNATCLQSFLEECSEMAAAMVGTDERKVIIQRQRDIVKIMPVEQKADSEVWFKRMSTVPVGRQFSVVPGTQLDEPHAERRRRCQRGLTVVPGLEKTLPPPPRSKTFGFQVFDI